MMSVIFQSKAMLQVIERAQRYARSSVTVLLCGESGTGKELLAQMIHQKSSRQSQGYVRLNCAALPETLIESELFGHEAGAFTGAQFRRLGRFETACDGTVFLDEIGELPYSMQAKLLRVLEEREFQRVGGNDLLRFTGRILAATNRDLQTEVLRGQFRDDLFHRLNVLPLSLPPLRERREDIPPLVKFFIQQSQPELEKPVRGVTPRVMEMLCEYDWPGNVRELKNVVLRFCILADSDVVDHIELPTAPLLRCVHPDDGEDEKPTTFPFNSLSLEEIEREVILDRLRCYHGNKTETAAALGVTTRTLRNKVTHYRKLGYAC